MSKAMALALLAGAGVASYAAPRLWQVGGEFVDEQERRLTLAEVAQWAGERAVVAMDSSECRFICSTQWRKLMEVQQAADRRGVPVRFVIISIDPANDTPAMWRQYRKEKGLSRDNWRFLIGSRSATEQAAAVLGLRWWRLEGHLIHDFRLVRLDRQGSIAGVMDNYAQPIDTFLAE